MLGCTACCLTACDFLGLSTTHPILIIPVETLRETKQSYETPAYSLWDWIVPGWPPPPVAADTEFHSQSLNLLFPFMWSLSEFPPDVSPACVHGAVTLTCDHWKGFLTLFVLGFRLGSQLQIPLKARVKCWEVHDPQSRIPTMDIHCASLPQLHRAALG